MVEGLASANAIRLPLVSSVSVLNTHPIVSSSVLHRAVNVTVYNYRLPFVKTCTKHRAIFCHVSFYREGGSKLRSATFTSRTSSRSLTLRQLSSAYSFAALRTRVSELLLLVRLEPNRLTATLHFSFTLA